MSSIENVNDLATASFAQVQTLQARSSLLTHPQAFQLLDFLQGYAELDPEGLGRVFYRHLQQPLSHLSREVETLITGLPYAVEDLRSGQHHDEDIAPDWTADRDWKEKKQVITTQLTVQGTGVHILITNFYAALGAMLTEIFQPANLEELYWHLLMVGNLFVRCSPRPHVTDFPRMLSSVAIVELGTSRVHLLQPPAPAELEDPFEASQDEASLRMMGTGTALPPSDVGASQSPWARKKYMIRHITREFVAEAAKHSGMERVDWEQLEHLRDRILDALRHGYWPTAMGMPCPYLDQLRDRSSFEVLKHILIGNCAETVAWQILIQLLSHRPSWLKRGSAVYLLTCLPSQCKSIISAALEELDEASHTWSQAQKEAAIEEFKQAATEQLCLLCWLVLSVIRQWLDPSGEFQYYQLVAGRVRAVPAVNLSQLTTELNVAEDAGWPVSHSQRVWQSESEGSSGEANEGVDEDLPIEGSSYADDWNEEDEEEDMDVSE